MSIGRRSNRKSRRQRQERSGRRLAVETLEPRLPFSATPFGALPHDTAEFLLGDVQVTVVLMESNDVISSDNPTAGTPDEENWTAASIASVKQKIRDGLQWWVDTLGKITDKHELNFNIDFTYADQPVSTRFEPITQPSTDYQFWIYDFLNTQLSETTGFFTTDVREFNHQSREANNANWGFTIFVVNDENDDNHRFAPGGLDRAFAFPGGLFLVTLASRPASTITHEAGHIFWALDEYETGARDQHLDTRGYYNTPNTNAIDNPIFSSQPREPSIMERGSCEEGGGLLCDAYTQHTSSQSSLEMLGWRDSDGNGVFDVLDVPHTLSGSGEYRSSTGMYRFRGESSAQTLPNLNPRVSAGPTESMQSDITINKVSRAEYRIDGGAWQTAATYETYTASIDVSFAVPETARSIEIRTIDAVTGVTSPVFRGTPTRPTEMLLPGINGFAFSDADQDGQFGAGESGLGDRTVRLVDENGQPLSLITTFDPDSFGLNQSIGDAVPGVTLKSIGSAVADEAVFSRSLSGGNRVFGTCTFMQGNADCGIYSTEWTSRSRQLRIDFDAPVTTVSLDAISSSDSEYGRLEVYDANDKLLERYTTAPLASGASETMTVNRTIADISYAIARGYADTSPSFDNLRFGPETEATTKDNGSYSIPYLEAGTYRVEITVPAGSSATDGTVQTVVVGEGEAVEVDFGFVAASNTWQNAVDRFDVNNDQFVSPIDALQIINDLNVRGSRALSASDVPPPFLDVSGDLFVSPLDVLLVINRIEATEAESESPPQESDGGQGIGVGRVALPASASHGLLPGLPTLPESEATAHISVLPQVIDAAFADAGRESVPGHSRPQRDATIDFDELFAAVDLTTLAEDVASA